MTLNNTVKHLDLGRGRLEMPVYLPDATFGVVRSVDADDLAACCIQAVVMNTFHLMQKPGSSTIQSLGGLHRMSGWERPIFTDSGGFQAYSLIRQGQLNGKLSDQGISFKPEGSQRKFLLTPEKCIQLQMGYGSDVVICLDDCTHVDASMEEQRRAVERTIAWAKRCKAEFQRLVAQKKLDDGAVPLLFAVVQGGGSVELRRQCAEALLAIGFDGYGYGGWPLDAGGNLLVDMLATVRQLIPAEFALHALGVGHPQNLLACYRLGYGIFDSAMPTRDARHGRLFAFAQPDLSAGWFDYVYINDERHVKADLPISPGCECLACRKYSRGYLHHLFKLGDSLYFRLATIHNLRFMSDLCGRARSTA